MNDTGSSLLSLLLLLDPIVAVMMLDSRLLAFLQLFGMTSVVICDLRAISKSDGGQIHDGGWQDELMIARFVPI